LKNCASPPECATDSLGYDFANNVPGLTSSNGATYYGQAGSTSKSFTRLSPKFGATYELTPKASIYASYNQGFRVPSESQLFRAGGNASASVAQSRAANALLLNPIKADQIELGSRWKMWGFESNLAAYELIKRDDLVSQKDPTTNASINQNAGKTQSRGIELSLGRKIIKSLKLETALTYAKHEYKEWKGKDASGNAFNYAGNTMAAAPRFHGKHTAHLDAHGKDQRPVRMGSHRQLLPSGLKCAHNQRDRQRRHQVQRLQPF
jgi:outer membrane receptor protein involved in Fe transport